jgi:hypothetical protein
VFANLDGFSQLSMSISTRPTTCKRLALTVYVVLATQIAFANPPAKDKGDGFVRPEDFGAAVDFNTICDDLGNGPSVVVPAELQTFVPSGTKPIEWHKADLNLDGRPDYVLVVEEGCDTRTLQVVVRKSDGSLSLAASNSQIIMERVDGGTAGGYDGTSVMSGAFAVSQTSGSGPISSSESVTFAWSKKARTWVVKEVLWQYCEMNDCHARANSQAVGIPFESYSNDP